MRKGKRIVYRVRWNRADACWNVDSWQDVKYVLTLCSTKRKAVDYAREQARRKADDGRLTQVVIFGKDGRIIEENTYPRSSDPKRYPG